MTKEELEKEINRLKAKKRLTRHDQLLARRYIDELDQLNFCEGVKEFRGE